MVGIIFWYIYSIVAGYESIHEYRKVLTVAYIRIEKKKPAAYA